VAQLKLEVGRLKGLLEDKDWELMDSRQQVTQLEPEVGQLKGLLEDKDQELMDSREKQ
jgi:hypothetical protein